MKIALICPTYNNEDLTINCFNSISKYVNTFEEITIIWVDNNSEFESRKKVHDCLKSLKNINFCNIFLTENFGFIKAVNIGIKYCLDKNFNYIGIINNDIEVSKNWLKNLYSILNKEVVMAGCMAYEIADNSISKTDLMENFELEKYNSEFFETVCKNLEKSNLTFKTFSFDEFSDYNFSKTCIAYYAVLFDQMVFTKIGLLNENFNLGYSDDTEFNFRITKEGYKIAKSFKSIVIHHRRSTFKTLFSNLDITNIQKGNKLQLRISKSLNKNHTKKFVIYTANINNYDNLETPSVFDLEKFDYICFTNSKELLRKNITPWTIIDISDICIALNLDDEVKYARYFKTHPHLFFENYEKSVWIDSNIDIIGDVEEFIGELRDSYLLTADHPVRNDIYEEIVTCNKLKKDSWENLNKIQKFLIDQGFPAQSTKLIQSGILARDHNNEKCKFLMNKWWEMIEYFSKRDQLSFNYIFWKYNGEYRSIPWDLLSMKYFTTDYKHGRQ